MSYEGQEEYLCNNGHLCVYDVWIDPFMGIEIRDGKIWEFNPSTAEFDQECPKESPLYPKCYVCGEAFVFHNSVDLTNGADETGLCPGERVYELNNNEEVQVKACPQCGHVSDILAVYVIPERNLFYGENT